MIDTFTERHLLPMMAPAAILRRIGRIDFDERSASFFRFARELGKECRPRGIYHAFGKTMVMNHAVHLEVFYADDPIGIDDLAAVLMGEVVTSEADTLMYSRYHLTVLTPFWCTFGKFGVLALHFCQGFLFLAKEAWVRYLFTIREGSKGLESHVNADLFRAFWQTLKFDFTRERGIPFPCRGTPNGQGFDLASYRPMQDDLEMSNTRAIQLALLIELETKLRKGEAIIAVFPSQSRIAGVLTCFAASEECLKSQINSYCYILQHLRMNSVQRWAFLFQSRVGRLLRISSKWL